MTSPLDRAKLAGIRPNDAPHNSTVQPVLSVPVSTTKEIQAMSTENTPATPATETAAPVTVTAADLAAMMAFMQQQGAQIAALTAQIQQQQSAPAPVAPQPEPQPEPEKPFVFPPPKGKVYIPRAVSVYAACVKDKETYMLTEELNGTIVVSLGSASRIAFIPDVWLKKGGVLEWFESGQARESIELCKKTGKQQDWKF